MIKKIPKHERMEDEDVGMDRVLKIKRPKRDQDANIEKHGSTMKKHKKDLQDLEKQDPEFFEFMKENDAGLPAFGGDEEEESDDYDEEEALAAMGDYSSEEDDEDDEEEEEDDEGVHVNGKTHLTAIEVTTELLKEANDGAKKGHYRSCESLCRCSARRAYPTPAK